MSKINLEVDDTIMGLSITIDNDDIYISREDIGYGTFIPKRNWEAYKQKIDEMVAYHAKITRKARHE